VADTLIVQGHDARTAKHLIFNDDAARQIAATLQRHLVSDTDVTFNVDIGADRASASNDGIFSNEYEIPYSGSLADLGVIRNNAVLPMDALQVHIERPSLCALKDRK